jgi:hypothetical protein
MRRKIDFIDIILVLIIMAVIAFAVFAIYCVEGAEVVEVYSVGCEVSQLAYAEETVSRSSSRPVYKMGVRCDDFATTLDISSNQFAQFVIGDIVEIEVTEIETVDGGIIYRYRLLGPCQE